MNISKDFTWDEMVGSRMADAHGIHNRPGRRERMAIEELVKRLLQPLRLAFGKPIKIISGYRCANLNKLVGGVASSQHVKGEAADCVVRGDATRLLGVLLANGFPFDQAILYKKRNFLHLSIRGERDNRREVIIKA